MNLDDVEQSLREGLARAAGPLTPPAQMRNTIQQRVRERARRRVALRAGCVGAVGVVMIGGLAWTRSGAHDRSVTSAPAASSLSTAPGDPLIGAAPDTTSGATVVPPATTGSTMAAVAPGGENILVTGVDNGACTDPGSPFAGGIGDRTAIGIRADTIMVLHLDPAARTAALVSFPRDLWVAMPGRGKGRISAAAQEGRYDLLAGVLADNFGVHVDHFVQVDFCAFTTVVDAVGGVTIPLPAAIRDANVGLSLPAGCHTFGGDEALAYMRSRHLETLGADGTWVADPTADVGRVDRQQDFLRRLLTTVVSRGLLEPSLAQGLVETMQRSVVIDQELTIDDMVDIGRTLGEIGAAGITTAQIPFTAATVQGSDVLVPDLGGPAAQRMLAVLRGQPAPAGAAPAGAVPTSAAGGASTPVVPDAAAAC